MKSLLVLLALYAVVAPSFAHDHHGHRRKQNPMEECNYVDSQGSIYDLSLLRDPPRGAYSFQQGKDTLVYFNVCGNLSQLVESACAQSPAGVCTSTSKGARNIGSASSSYFSDYNSDGYGVTLTYSSGAYCNNSGVASTWSTELNFACPEEASDIGLGVTNFGPSSTNPCTIQLNLTSVFACPVQTADSLIWFPIMSWMLMFSAACLCCAGCCACARRRRAQSQVRKEMERVYSTGASPSEYTVVPLMEPSVSDSAPASTTEYNSYYYPANQQFYTNQAAFQMQPMVASMYPYSAPPMMSTQIPAASAPSTVAMGNIRTPVLNRAPAGSNAPTAMTDEMLARSLQAQYDNEASLL